MFIHEILNPLYEPLRASNSVEDGLMAMGVQHCDVLPVVDYTTGKLLGTVERADILSEKDRHQTIFPKIRRKPCTLYPNTHISDACRQMSEANSRAAVVSDDQESYLGFVLRNEIDAALIRLLNPDFKGATIMVEMEPADYCLTDLVRLTELEGGKILSIGVEPAASGTDRFRVSIKLNTDDIDPILRVLNRYGFIITSKSKETETDDDLHDRADQFMRFLSI
ncbi:MAG: CBS domain-containing protein [Candidatus Cyclonatronum sp.]|uniref:CBS domain-containing protein n=1 Tax=Cyclonatronum sp. TaxID=3024185 RepID=UPI0025C1F0C7|nr:CBS domain-containing protein [Cyclonatronum sp.]MCC5934135.1 CBS domain-containing protein [Balneolales bacterium]MCH8486252.1 CBS domain-containing protein [Cyclonatronum sp.]